MSRVAKSKILIPEGVNIDINNNIISIKGKNGVLKKLLHKKVFIKNKNNTLKFYPSDISNNCWVQAGTERSLINSMIIGVSKGFEKKLNLIGVGYKANIEQNYIVLYLGFSHTIKYFLPKKITATCPIQTEIIIKGINKQLVNQVAAKIRSYRKPEPYKGKGIRYENEFIKIKESKKK